MEPDRTVLRIRERVSRQARENNRCRGATAAEDILRSASYFRKDTWSYRTENRVIGFSDGISRTPCARVRAEVSACAQERHEGFFPVHDPLSYHEFSGSGASSRCARRQCALHSMRRRASLCGDTAVLLRARHHHPRRVRAHRNLRRDKLAGPRRLFVRFDGKAGERGQREDKR